MGQLRVGAGGWDYFFVASGDRLKAYSSVFDFVEVNSTYYELPDLKTVAGWRDRVPPGFEFSVRCPRGLVEQHRLELNPMTVPILDNVEKICRRLRATVLTLLFSNHSVVEAKFSSRLDGLLSTVSFGGTRIAVEFRGADPSEDVLRVLRDYNAIHCVDISKGDPGVGSNILYSRLFGKGEKNIYEFDDGELKSVGSKAADPKFEKSILAFHGVRMYRDAARLKTFVDSGRFPSLTWQVGLESLAEILREDTVFPTSKSQLIDRQGWKLFDMTAEERARVKTMLDRLPDRTYSSLKDVLGILESPF